MKHELVTKTSSSNPRALSNAQARRGDGRGDAFAYRDADTGEPRRGDERYAASRQFGWVESIKETCREHRGVSWIEHLIQDLRYGLRMLPQLRSGRAMDSGARQTHRENPRQRLQRHAARVGRQGRPSEIARRWHQLARCDRCVGPRRLPGLGDFGATRQPGSRRRNRLNLTDTQRV